MCDSGLSGEGLSSADPLNCTIRRDNTEYLVLPTYVQSTASIGPRTLVPTDMDGRDSEPHILAARAAWRHSRVKGSRMPLLIRSECDHDIIPDELSCQLGPDAGGFVVVGVEKSACENHGRGATPVGMWPSTHKYAPAGR